MRETKGRTAPSQDLNCPEERKRSVYAAFAAGDARFDGQMFMGVLSTGIYCRTVCTARMPKYENCTFFRTAAEAEEAGYRPCLTCRPEVAPGTAPVDARPNLARRAAAMIREGCASGRGIEATATRLGYTGRHLRRTFVEEYGVTPSQYAQTCRLLLAKALLTDSSLPIAQVAQAAGFGSVRRLNATFRERYRLTPSDLRKRVHEDALAPGTLTLRLGYRPPYLFNELLDFFRKRALKGVEVVGQDYYARTVALVASDGTCVLGWVRIEQDARRNQLVITMPESLAPCVSRVAARVRRMFDVDCNPGAIARGLASLNAAVPGAVREGTRLPGCFDPFETACRAVLGQQVTLAAANRLAARVVEAYGRKVDVGIDGLSRTWPTPQDVLALDSVEEAFGQLGVVRSRSRAIAQIAHMLESRKLDLGPGALAHIQMHALQEIKGIGPWTANYIALRVLGHPDAFMETDAGVAHALPSLSPKQRLAAAEAWHPWRSYAVLSLWNAPVGTNATQRKEHEGGGEQ